MYWEIGFVLAWPFTCATTDLKRLLKPAWVPEADCKVQVWIQFAKCGLNPFLMLVVEMMLKISPKK